MRKVSVILSVIVFMIVAYWAFHNFVNKQRSVFDPLSVVSDDALLIAEFRNGGQDAATFYQRSMVWKDFEETPFGQEAKPFFQFIDSLKSNQRIVISVHKGHNENQSLITISDPEQNLQKLLISYGAEKDKVASSSIYTIVGLPYIFDIHEEYVQIAKSRDFLNQLNNLIEQGKSISKDSSFAAIRSGIESGHSIELFINLGAFTESMNQKIIEDIYDFPQNLNGWLASELYDKANTIVSSGFIEFDPQEDNFFKSFEGQSPQGLHYFDVIPANTAILTSSSYSNPVNYLSTIDASDEQINYFSSWLGNVYGNGVLNGERDLTELRFAFFEFRDEKTFLENTEVFIDQSYSPTAYRDFTISRLDSTFSFQGFEEGISGLKQAYFTIIKDQAIFSSNEETIKEIIKRYSNNNTLSKQESFSNLRDELSDETNYLFYISPAMAGSFLASELADSLRNYWLPNEDKINSLQALIVQVSSYKRGKMYVHSALRHQVVNFEEKDNSLWEVYLENPVKGKIQLVRNHYTQHLEIAVQDSNNTLFVINNKGEILWKRDLDGEILGDIKQIDIYKNGKLQLLFNTNKTLYCMDRKGNDLEKFPVKLKEESNLPLALFDYDSNKNYRILLAFPSGDLEMFDSEGTNLKGWKYEGAKSAITETPQHIRIGKKDYIYTSTANGTILLLDRKGKMRFRAKQNIGDKNGSAYTYTGRSIESSGIYYIDTLGGVVHLAFGGQKEYMAIKGEKGDKLYMARVNEDNTREFILYNDTKILVFDLNANPLFDEVTVGQLAGEPQKYRFNKQNWLGYTDDQTKESFLLDVNGNAKADTPFAGIGLFSIGDINLDGILELIVQGENGQIVVYSLSK
jgi:hypothetical protein